MSFTELTRMFPWLVPSGFMHPWYLVALLIPLALLFWVWWPKTPKLVLPYDHGRSRRGPVWRVMLDLAGSLPPLLLAIAIVLLAEPQQFGEPKEKRSLTNIEICLDVSGSMTAEFGEGTRYDAAMKSVDEFLSYRKGDAFGLTFFGNEYLHWCPLTTDVSAIRCSPPFMRPENIPIHFGGTEIGKAIKASRKVLEERQEGDKMILLVTDGFSSDLGAGSDVEIANQMKAAGVMVFSVIIGDSPAQEEVKTICHMTGGESFEAGDPAALPEVFKRIDQMKPAKVTKTMPDLSDNFWFFAVLGLSALGLMTLTALGLRAAPW
jgi:Ca-activated chloride channel family protein